MARGYTDHEEFETAEQLACRIATALPHSVVREIHHQHQRGGPAELDYVAARSVAGRFSAEGSLLLLELAKRFSPGRVLADLAYAVAVLSFLPGGITIFGQTYKSVIEDQTGDQPGRSKRENALD